MRAKKARLCAATATGMAWKQNLPAVRAAGRLIARINELGCEKMSYGLNFTSGLNARIIGPYFSISSLLM